VRSGVFDVRSGDASAEEGRGMRRVAPLVMVALFICAAAQGGELGEKAKKRITAEYHLYWGYARHDLNKTRISPDLKTEKGKNKDELIPKGSKVKVRDLEFGEDEIIIGVDMDGSKKSTKLRFKWPSKFHSEFTEEQWDELKAMWDHLISTKRPK
jgi:hypothetical protein